ncbi:OmpA family protein [Nevskia sp.]|uniref:OmpA family protein n=1 Tax=Nevskia sp. TaxID=1929292 RepID=UPI0025FE12F8|nr:OmpA family protein [Nevskia sp.]
MKSVIQAFAGISLSCLALSPALAQETGDTPFKTGVYVSPLGSGVFQTSKGRFPGTGYGGTLGIGYRSDWYAFELAPTYLKFDGIDVLGGGINSLVFPLKGLFANSYLIGGIAALQYRSVPTNQGIKEYNTLNLQGGVGQLWPLRLGNHDFAIRTEVLYRYGNRERDFNDQDIDLDVAKRYNSIVANVGLYIPLFGNRVTAPPPPPPAPEVVPVEPPKDSDGDGVFDDVDQCPDSPPGSVVDETGCPPPPTPAPVPTCKTPGPGEKISLAGCGTGDNIVLRGVNFDTNQATLTVNARALLDDVAGELTRYPEIQVQVGGHTDSRGSAALNDSLSKRRAASVMAYLVTKGIAAERMSSAGFGPNEPIADNATDEGRELNRRVELKIVAGNAAAEAAAAASTE